MANRLSRLGSEPRFPRPFQAGRQSVSIVDESPAQDCPQRSSPLPSSLRDDVPICLAVLELLLDVVDASVFVVARPGQIVLSNAQGRAMLASRGEELHAFLRVGTVDLTVASSELAAWSAGSLRGWRRGVDIVDRDCHFLVTVEQAGTSAEALVDRAIHSWSLTDRQAAVFRLVCEGLSNKEIAGRLAIAGRTVEVYISTLFEKAAVDSRARLIATTMRLQEPGQLPLRRL